ncbi:MAG: winged helix DNA-binding domain-containing protein, partial [Chloroflexota bacterium]|nr:winged helix DNA-binding domain-containing protein [Chloroflexota bacterium]
MKLSISAARQLMLAAQGLLRRPDHAARKADVLAAIQRMGALQLDTISVIARSHELALWSRLGIYDPRWLYELLAEGALFEYWSHAACFLPREDFGLYRRLMTDGPERRRAWMAEHAELVERVLARVR